MKQHTEAENQAAKILIKNNITTYPVDVKRIVEKENIELRYLFDDVSTFKAPLFDCTCSL